MKVIPATKFKQQCLRLLQTVGPEGIVITKRGRPVARLVGLHLQPRDLIGALRDRIKVRGSLLSTGVRWDAQDQS